MSGDVLEPFQVLIQLIPNCDGIFQRVFGDFSNLTR